MKAKALREYSDVSGCSSVTCSSLSSPQRKPGSGRLKGQSLLSSDTCVYDCQKVKNLTLGDVMCLAHMICWLSETKKITKD